VLTGWLVAVLAVSVAVADDVGAVPPPSESASAPAAEPAPAPAPEPPAPGEVPPNEALQAAIDAYLDGRPQDARRALQELLARGPSVPAEVRRDALAYLGDILLSEQGEAAARSVFEALLADAPAYQMDPFRHPPEVVRAFEAVRRTVVPPTGTPTVRPVRDADPYPWMVALPAGAWYFKERRVVPGLLVATAQGAGLGLSVWSRGEMQALQEEVERREIAPGEDTGGTWKGRYDRLRVINALAFTAGWAGYFVPLTVETVRWGASGASAQVGVGPGSVRVVGRF